MSFDSIAFLIRKTFSNMFKNFLLTAASITVLTICLVIFGASILIIENVNIFIDAIGSQSKVVIYIDENLTDSEIITFKNKLDAIPNIVKIEFESKDDALEKYKKSFAEEYENLIEGLESDTFRNSFIFEISDISKFDQTIYEVEKLEGVANINQKRDVVEKITDIRDIMSFLAAWIIFFLILISFFIISNSVKTAVFSKKDEIAIMKYVGSTDAFIKFPYFTEGFIVGCVSGALSYVVLQYVYDFILSPILLDLDFFVPVSFNSQFTYMLWVYLAAGAVIGSISSVAPVGKYLEV